ncbi:PEP-CTERM sorting domain-containing protein [Methylomonas rosea]|uniref:PEP-CTERM sorting domain-containing protein n=1 Tax=Methylomonas rosea TaxID=2952227 RepID=A0ABT1TYL2_9GAMM|nr:PEP-CTERM sorting domain-containing protein [Methylomonas sp. WSC-7]MCQ8119862.1 PEP-CTERM sorting domain-containing protein [Methylomonas sp. WSC-7]
MNKKMMMVAVLVALSVSAGAEAAVITQWNFNSNPADAATGTGSTSPSIGSGAASLLGTTATFASGDASGGSSDPATGDDSGWNTSGYAAQGAGNKTRGTQYLVSTVGFDNIQISYDLRHSNTSSKYEQVQYTTDGSSWTDFSLFSGATGDTWFNGRSVDLSSIAGVANNANFGFRVLAAFAPATSAYAASSPTGTYGTAGTWRFDMVTVSGTAVAAVPVPGAVWLFGSALLGFLGVRRNA